MIAEYSLISFSSVSASTEAHGTSISELEKSSKPSAQSWECGRFASFPQEVVLRLDHRIQFSYIIISTKPDKLIPELEIYIGDGIYGSFLDAEYHFGGKAYHLTPQNTQVPVSGIGIYIKFLFVTKPKLGPNNPYGQVSLGAVKVWGRKIDYSMNINNISPVKSNSDEVDKILLGMGVPLEIILWSKEDFESYRYAPIDEDSRETLMELDLIKSAAYNDQDFTNLKQITIDMKIVFEIGSELLKLKRELSVAVAKEDYDAALVLKNRITLLEKKRDMIDATYGTKRYYKMMKMGMPSDSYMEMINKMLEDERLKVEMLRRQQQEDDERHRNYLEDLERKRRLEEMKNTQKKSPIQTKKKIIKETEEKNTVSDDPYTYNEGDIDLETYLKPRLNEVGGKLITAHIDLLKRADVKKILRVVGVRLWSCLYSDNWRHREAAVQAFLEFIEAPLIPKYEEDTRNLFRAAIDIAVIASEDKVMPIYLYGLKILITAMSSPICDKKVTPKMINEAMRIFIPILLDKVSEFNYRARDISMNTLIELFRHPKIKVGPLIEYIMNLANTNGVHLEKQPWRIILSRLEILMHIIQEFGVNESEWKWKDVLNSLIFPLLSHANSDVRNTCVEIIIGFYEKVGMEIRIEIEGLGRRIKPVVSQNIYKKMLEIDQNKGMRPIHETQEWTEQTPPGSAKGMKWNELKERITNLAVEESKKV
jgi:centrosomal protein CEP104